MKTIFEDGLFIQTNKLSKFQPKSHILDEQMGNLPVTSGEWSYSIKVLVMSFGKFSSKVNMAEEKRGTKLKERTIVTVSNSH